MNLIETSLAIALQAHSGQTDKAGQAYILHPLRIMAKMDTEEEMAVALLHDVLEDSSFTAQDLQEAGIPPHVVAAVQLLSKQDGEEYDTFIERLLPNPLAAKVKKADIEDNLNILRLQSLTEKDWQRVDRYHHAWHKLTNNTQAK
jgi:(p)ppGpp synthase/HD superfamily hydrolase